MFDKILYINLKHRTARDENVINQLNKIDRLHLAERIDAINGLELDIINIDDNLITDLGKHDALESKRLYTHLTKGGIGCALSHLEAYNKIINDNIKAALILEDDIRIDKSFNEQLDKLAKIIPKDFDILFLGYHDSSNQYLQKSANEYFTKPDRLYGLFGYIVTNAGAHKLLDIFPITFQLDTEMPFHFDRINAYAITPKYRVIFSDQSSIYSTFGTDIQIREGYEGGYSWSLYDYLLILLFANILLIIIIYNTHKCH